MILAATSGTCINTCWFQAYIAYCFHHCVHVIGIPLVPCPVNHLNPTFFVMEKYQILLQGDAGFNGWSLELQNWHMTYDSIWSYCHGSGIDFKSIRNMKRSDMNMNQKNGRWHSTAWNARYIMQASYCGGIIGVVQFLGDGSSCWQTSLMHCK